MNLNAILQNPDQRKSLKLQIDAELVKRFAAEGDVLSWGRTLFPYKFYKPYCHAFHDHLIKTRAFPYTNTEGPRNHAKTAIECFLIPMFQSLHEPFEFAHYLNVQSTEKKSLDVNRSMKFEFETNELLKYVYGEMTGERWTDQQFVIKSGVVFTAIGAGQSIRGINYRNIRPDYIIVDDLYDEEDINSPDSTGKKNDWFWSSLYPARAKTKTCSIHVQGTAINNEDLLFQLKKNPRWESRTFKAITDWDKKEVLWPELNTFESLMEDKFDMGSVIFFREMQNERRDDSSSIIKSAWLNKWEYDANELFALIGKSEHMYISAVIVGDDPSIGKNNENDYTGRALIIKTQYRDGTGNDYWIHNLWNEHWSLDQRVLTLNRANEDLPKELKMTNVNIEGIAGFKDYVAEVIRRTNLPVHEVDKVIDKLTHLENKSHFFENGKVHLNRAIGNDSEGHSLKDTLKYQLTTNHPKYDDLRDGVLMALDSSAGLWNFIR